MNRQKGFTLIELLVALAISSTILLMVFQIFINLNVDYIRNVNRFMTNSDINPAITAIHRDLMVAQEISTTGNLTTIRWTDYSGNQTTHVVTYGFNETENTILERTYDNDLQIIGRHISSLTFTSDNETITAVITSVGTKSTQRSKTIEITVKTRGELEES